MSHSRIRFRHLQTLVEVARQRSVSLAANVLNVSQPAVTKTIRELEAALETQLLEKQGRGIKVTEAGEVFLKYAGASISAVRQGVDAVSPKSGNRGPTLRVGALPTVSARIMPQAIERFVGLESEQAIRVITGENTVLLNQLRVGDLDLVVGRLAAPDQMTGLSFEHLYSEQIEFVVRKGHPLTQSRSLEFERIAEFVVLMPPPQSIIRPFLDRLMLTHGMGNLPSVIETVSDSFGRAYLRQTDAVWIISHGVVANELTTGAFVALPVDTTQTQGSVGLTTRPEIVSTPHLQTLMQTIRDAAHSAMGHPPE